MGAAKENRDANHYRKALSIDQEHGREQQEIREIIASFHDDSRNSYALRIELDKSRALIERLRAENQVLRDEKRQFMEVVEMCKHHISVAGNCHKKYGVSLVKSQLQKARLI